MAAPPIIHPKSSRENRQKTFSRPIQVSARLPHPANIEHPARFFAYKKRRFDSVRDEVRPWVTSRSELSVVPRVENEDQVEQHGPSDPPSSVSIGVYLKACRRNIQSGQPLRHYGNLLGMKDQSWLLVASLEELTDIPVCRKIGMHTDDAVASLIKCAVIGRSLSDIRFFLLKNQNRHLMTRRGLET